MDDMTIRSLWYMLIATIIVIILFLAFWLLTKPTKEDKMIPPRRKLTDEEAEWMADYYHNADWAPDIDGFLSTRYLPIEATRIYIKKYGKARGWSEEAIQEELKQLGKIK